LNLDNFASFSVFFESLAIFRENLAIFQMAAKTAVRGARRLGLTNRKTRKCSSAVASPSQSLDNPLPHCLFL